MIGGLLTHVGRSLLRGHFATESPDPPQPSNDLLIGLSAGLCLGVACALLYGPLRNELPNQQ